MDYNSEQYFPINCYVKDWVVTGGIMYFCEQNGCFWILDVVASYAPTLIKLKADYLKIIEVVVNLETGQCVLTISDEINGELVRQEILSDLKTNVKFWAITEGDKTIILLPSEY